MKPLSFFQGVGLALALSVAGSALFALFSQISGSGTALRLLIPLLSAAYLLYLVRGSAARVGVVSTVLAWIAVTGVTWILQPDLLVYLLIHVAMLWLVRCLFFYRSLLAALMDMGLQALSLAAAIWALQETGSLLLCLWSLFLVQALFVAIPPTGFKAAPTSTDRVAEDAGFQRAHRSAEAALRRLCSTH